MSGSGGAFLLHKLWHRFDMWTVLSITMAGVALFLTLRRDFFLRPNIEYSITPVTEYPPGPGLGLAVGRTEIGGMVKLKYGVLIWIRSVGARSASNVQVRATTEGGAFFVVAHTDESKLIERLPDDLNRQAEMEVFINIPLMVAGEQVKFTLWYGIPNGGETEPPLPTVLVRHADGLGIDISAKGRFARYCSRYFRTK